MWKFDGPNAVLTKPAYPSPGTEAWFGEGDPAASPVVFPSNPDRPWFNMMMAEQVNVVAAAGLARSKSVDTQLAQGVALIGGGAVNAVLTASATLTLAQQGMVPIDATSGDITLTLPAANALAAAEAPSSISGQTQTLPAIGLRYAFVRTDSSSHVVTIARAGSDTIEGATTLVLAPGERVQLQADGVSAWRGLGAGLFSRSLGGNGWQKLPSGLLLQWGSFAATTSASGGGGVFEGNVAVTFPLAFPNSLYSLALSVLDVSGANLQETAWANSLNNSGFGGNVSCRQASTTMTAYFIAFGR